ncbi:natural killer cells antigen CD94-like isoform X2 [Protopterus annectens]|uniref:natural killer cells antigen CD94-like isoform X2 n=1 Tax=Protopterus annectens TaxID=7888 RepID=UPI001CFB2BAD|nr:natural killer cells antigen CD94-like isoform X2 [Protopterus annectens]
MEGQKGAIYSNASEVIRQTKELNQNAMTEEHLMKQAAKDKKKKGTNIYVNSISVKKFQATAKKRASRRADGGRFKESNSLEPEKQHSRNYRGPKPAHCKCHCFIFITSTLCLLLAVSVAVLTILLISSYTSCELPEWKMMTQRCKDSESNETGKCSLCPEKWIGYHGKCYLFSDKEMNWTSSKKFCSAHQSSLFTEQQEEAVNFAKNVSKQIYYWTAITKSDNTWIWESGIPVNTTIFPVSINTEQQRCVAINSLGFSASSCGTDLNFICIKDAFRNLH